MNNREVALKFIRRFCAGDVDGLALLLAEDLRFKGPLPQFGSRDAYLDCLKNDPPRSCAYQVLSVTESGDSVSVFYEYEKGDGGVTIAQLFKFKDRGIAEILLVFDGRGLG